MVLRIRFIAIYPEEFDRKIVKHEKKHIKIMEEKNEQIV